MRLTIRQQELIREKVEAAFGPCSHARPFDSRTDDAGRSGDIDLHVETDQALENRAAAASRLAGELQIALGDQRIDVILVDWIEAGNLQFRLVHQYMQDAEEFAGALNQSRGLVFFPVQIYDGLTEYVRAPFEPTANEWPSAIRERLF